MMANFGGLGPGPYGGLSARTKARFTKPPQASDDVKCWQCIQ